MPVQFLVFWLILVWGLGWLCLPVARHIWTGRRPLSDGGLAAGRILLLCLWTMLAFWAGNAGLPTRAGAALVVPLAAACVYLGRTRWPELRDHVRAHRRGIIVSESIFLVVFIAFFLLRGFWPDIGNGEKPMDMALIGACARAAHLPPPNPYAAGERQESYYYLGHLQAALLTDAIGASPRWTYNLACATLPALIFSVLVSLCAALTGSLRRGLLAAGLVLVPGTLEPLSQWFNRPPGAPGGIWPIDYFATSRVVPFTINEYPWFTFNYGDLHAHYFAMPLALLAICLAWALCRFVGQEWTLRRAVLLTAAAGLVLGALGATSTWDLPTYWLAIVLCTACFDSRCLEPREPAESDGAASASPRGSILVGKNRNVNIGPAADAPCNTFRRRCRWRWAAMSAGSLMLALLAAAPFLALVNTAADPPRWLPQPASPTGPWLLVWLVPVGAWVMALAIETRSRVVAEKVNVAHCMWFAAGPGAIWLALYAVSGSDHFVLLAILSLGLWSAWVGLTTKDAILSWLCRLAVCGSLALLWSETTYAGFLDSSDWRRMDTVFKFGMQAWYLIGIAAACANLRLIGGEANAEETPSIWSLWPITLRCACLVLLAVMLTASAADTQARALGFQQFRGWDAWSNLAPPERDAAAWLAANCRDGDYIVEAEKPTDSDYSEYTRYANATGVPTVVGPAAHTFYWGPGTRAVKARGFWPQINQRKADVRAFYTVVDNIQRLKLAHKYGVRYVVCGDLERAQYGDWNVDSLETAWPVVFWSGSMQDPHQVAICSVPGS